MAGIDLAMAEAKLNGWIAADDALQNSQSYSIGGRMLTRADADEIRNNITYWNNWVTKLSRTGARASRVKGGVPV